MAHATYLMAQADNCKLSNFLCYRFIQLTVSWQQFSPCVVAIVHLIIISASVVALMIIVPAYGLPNVNASSVVMILDVRSE